MERFGLTGSTGEKGRPPDNAVAEGFFGGMRVGSVHPERWEDRTRGEMLALIDGCIHRYDHARIRQSLGWMSPVQYRLSHGLAA
ncbi:MAG: integrase core domain-containing protein [Bifidobacterium adolescentis]